MDAEEGVFCMVLRSDLFCDRMRFPFGCVAFGCVAFGCVFLSGEFSFRMCFAFECALLSDADLMKDLVHKNIGSQEILVVRVSGGGFVFLHHLFPGGCLFASETVVTLSDFGRHFATTEISAHITVVRGKKGQNLIFQQFVVGGRIPHSAGAE